MTSAPLPREQRTDGDDSDIALVGRARNGDLPAAERLLERYQNLAYTAAYRLLANRAEAEDVAQDALMRAYTHLSSLRDDAGFPAWLRKIAVNRSLNVLRRRRSHPEEPPDDTSAQEATDDEDRRPLEVLVRAELAAQLTAHVESLPDAQRVALMLHDVYDYPVAEVAELQRCGISAVKMRLSRARSALRSRLQDDEKHEPFAEANTRQQT